MSYAPQEKKEGVFYQKGGHRKLFLGNILEMQWFTKPRQEHME